MTDPNANIILRRKIKSKIKMGKVFLELMESQMRGEDLSGQITKKSRESKLEPMLVLKSIRKYIEKVDGRSYKLAFTPEIVGNVDHFIEEFEIFSTMKKSDRNIVLCVLIYKFMKNGR